MNLYETYIDIQSKIDKLEEDKEQIREAISSQLPEEGYKDEKISVFFTVKKKYTYSEEINKLSENLKEQKKKEEESGIAPFSETKQLTIKIKENE